MNPLDDAIQHLDALIAKLTAADPSLIANSGGQKANSGRATCAFEWKLSITILDMAEFSYDRAGAQHTGTSVTEAKAAPQVEADGQSIADPDKHSAETSAKKPKAKKKKQPAVKVPAAVPDSGAGLFARAQLQACSLSYYLPLLSPNQS